MPDDELHFRESTAPLPAVNQAIKVTLPDWQTASVRRGSSDPSDQLDAISDTDVAANAQFIRICEDPQLKIDITQQDLATFWVRQKENWAVLSSTAVNLLIQSP